MFLTKTNNVSLSTVFAYDIAADTWTQKNEAAPDSSSSADAVEHLKGLVERVVLNGLVPQSRDGSPADIRAFRDRSTAIAFGEVDPPSKSFVGRDRTRVEIFLKKS